MERTGPQCGGPKPGLSDKGAAILAAGLNLVSFARLGLFAKKRCAQCQKPLCSTSQEQVTRPKEGGLSYCDLSNACACPVRCPQGTKQPGESLSGRAKKAFFRAIQAIVPGVWKQNLRPALGGVFPADSPGRLWGRTSCGLRDPDRLLGQSAHQGCFAVGNLGHGFFVVREERRSNTQRFHLLFQFRQLKFFLSQNLVNVLHVYAPKTPWISTSERRLCTCSSFVKKEEGHRSPYRELTTPMSAHSSAWPSW